METTFTLFKTILIFLALAVPGFVLIKTKNLKAESTEPLSIILIKIGIPFMVFASTLKMELDSENVKNMIITAIVTTVFTAVCFYLSRFIPVKGDDINKRRMIRLCSVAGNTGFLGIPIATAAFGQGAVLDTVVVVNVFSVAVIYTIGQYVVSGDKRNISAKGLLLNPVNICFVLGILLNAFSVTEVVPEIQKFADYLSGLVTPLAMIVLGIKLGTVNFKTIFANYNTYKVSFYKLIVFPVLITAIMFLLRLFIEIPSGVIIGVFLGNAMPVASSCTTYADNYKCDVEGAVSYTMGTTSICIITISLLYMLLQTIV